MLFITSTAQATRHGIYAIERNPPTTITAQNAGVAAIAEQFPWGPDGIVYTIGGIRDFCDTFAPGGASRTGAGYMSIIGKAWPVLKVVRVLGSTAAAASAVAPDAVPATIITMGAKYKGSLGNSLTWTVSDATDGVSQHFNLTITLTSATGTTQDIFENLNYSGTGADSTPSFVNTKLIGSITKTLAGRPANGTGSFSSGADGTVTSADYVGTQGSTDKGIALFEADKSVDVVFTGDPGNSLRAAINAGLRAHADFLTDRIAFINGNSGLSSAAAITDVASYRSLRVCYIDCWAYQRDDVDGTEHLLSPAPFAASVAVNLSPSTSFAWKSSSVQQLLTSITRLETARGDQAYQNTQAGICTLQQEALGGFTFEAAVVTYAPLDPTRKNYKRTRMGHYIARAVVTSLREFTDSPNVPFNQQDEVLAVHGFLDVLKQNAKTNPNALPHVLDFSIPQPLSDFNLQADLDQGKFTIPANVKVSSDQSQIFFSLQIGETVNITTQL